MIESPEAIAFRKKTQTLERIGCAMTFVGLIIITIAAAYLAWFS